MAAKLWRERTEERADPLRNGTLEGSEDGARKQTNERAGGPTKRTAPLPIAMCSAKGFSSRVRRCAVVVKALNANASASSACAEPLVVDPAILTMAE